MVNDIACKCILRFSNTDTDTMYNTYINKTRVIVTSIFKIIRLQIFFKLYIRNNLNIIYVNYISYPFKIIKLYTVDRVILFV